MGDISIKETSYKDYGKCIAVSNGTIEFYVTVDVGPRIIRYGFVNGDNIFCENNKETKKVPSGDWKIRGGHRLWHSPEADPRTYMPDNDHVEFIKIDNGIIVSNKPEPWVQIKKEMEITIDKDKNNIKIVHKLTNKNAWTVEAAVWALSVMASGGKQLLRQTDSDTGLLPNRMISLWPYSKMNDNRIYWGDKYITLRQDTYARSPFKLGMTNEYGWAAYFNKGILFIKRFEYIKNAKYPDYGASYETYTNNFMMEMESLSPLYLIKPDETITHIENLELVNDVKVPADNEEEIDELVNKYIE